MYPKTFFEKNDIETESGRCFILMPFDERFREVYDLIKTFIEDEMNLTCYRADDFFASEHIIESILRNIAQAEVILADLTDKNPNVFYELGIAHMIKDYKKVIILTQDISQVPFDLRQFRCIEYQQSISGSKNLKSNLKSAIEEVIKPGFSINEGEIYHHPDKYLGEGRFLYDFKIEVGAIGGSAVKMALEVFRHKADGSSESAINREMGIQTGEPIEIPRIPYLLKLVNTRNRKASFILIKKSSEK